MSFSKHSKLIFIFWIALCIQCKPKNTTKANKEEPLMKLSDDYVLQFNENFNSKELDSTNWLPYFLPHWSSRKQAAANYEIEDGNLVLKITKEQQPWCPSLNGDIKCSNIQTGIYSGAIGSKIGQHRFSEDCVVTEEQPTKRLYTPKYGYFEIRAKANIEPSDMVAFWMIGFEDRPEHSGEICIMEIFGHQIEKDSLINGSGIHPFGDKGLVDDFHYDKLKMDISEFHTFSVDWQPNFVKYYVDGKHIRTINQSPNYPMQFMIDIFEFPDKPQSEVSAYPKEFIIDYVKGYGLKE
ncbi:glycoside hydrolase family 16 protein [Costertonia aggregata]|uniref:Glycoside hydrolase family 16 protein n=1 Tax=Costertonia aggregata TaxID=343403 RepID=A0A7H9AMR8_9FLAO|nr:glycoside hydrolase family 16 protein [Costertonia aggregata]QLG44741.1 glycoside hydrolase family 16 protein [Costertonia aggregata]